MGQGKIAAIVPAAGLGKRFGEEKNKPFYLLLDKPLIIRTLEALQSVEEIAEIIPVLKENDLIVCGDLIEQYNITKVKRIVPGGQERQDSVYNGIKILDNNTSIVLVHDGARPLIEADLIRRALAELKDCDGVVAGVPVKDTIKEVHGSSLIAYSKGDSPESTALPVILGQSPCTGEKGLSLFTDEAQRSRRKGTVHEYTVKQTLNRNILWAIQTPQVFFHKKIRDAYVKAAADKYYATDDAALVEHYGGNIKVIMGSYRNIKITTPEDILIAEALLKI